MDLGLKDKVVLIAGSSHGIGKAAAHAFLEEGAHVVVTGRNEQKLSKTFREFDWEFPGKVLKFRGDLEKEAQTQKCVKVTLAQWKNIDVLVANIGSGKSKPILEADRQEWQRMLDINLLGAVTLIREVIPVMQRQKSGNIILTSSIAGQEYVGAPESYAAAKAALFSYAKSLASALAKDHIRVNAVAPGNIKFPGGRWEEIMKEKPRAVKEMIDREVPMQRFGSPEEVAASIVFLASDRASFITGSHLVVDGGQSRSF